MATRGKNSHQTDNICMVIMIITHGFQVLLPVSTFQFIAINLLIKLWLWILG